MDRRKKRIRGVYPFGGVGCRGWYCTNALGGIHGQVGVVQALSHARAMFREAQARACLVVAVDSLIDALEEI